MLIQKIHAIRVYMFMKSQEESFDVSHSKQSLNDDNETF